MRLTCLELGIQNKTVERRLVYKTRFGNNSLSGLGMRLTCSVGRLGNETCLLCGEAWV